MRKHRLFYILLAMIACLVVLNGRLFWIQVAASRNWSEHGVDLVENSVIQREKGIVLDSGRGDFYDSHGVALTGKELQVLTVFPFPNSENSKNHFPENNAHASERIAAILHRSEQEWVRFAASLKSPEVWKESGKPVELNEQQIAQIRELNLPQLAVTKLKQRYGESQLASHVIGYIGQNPERITRQFTDQFHRGELQLTSKIGGAGLEKAFEPWLQGIGATTLSLFTDAAKKPLSGLDARTVAPNNAYYPLKFITTLDASIQKRVEQAMRKLQIEEGAAVVLDATNADVLAMASQPGFNPEHIDLANGTWTNKALKAMAPGSIFKTVTAAAALDEHAARAGEKFHCDGEYGKYGLTCWNKEGHGTLTLEEGYAQSCNIVFATIAERLGGVQLEDYAARLGLGVNVGWTGDFMQLRDFQEWDSEEKGQVFAAGTRKEDGGVKAQSSIGQRDVQVTPLQAANLVVTLLNQGDVKAPRIVKEVRYQNGRLLEALKPKEVGGLPGRISAGTAKRLLSWMEDVVDHGTGKALQQTKWAVAGKSGTAQVTDAHGNKLVNQWFIGYGPVPKPRYAVAVLVQNVPESDKNKSIPLFREVMDSIAAHQW
ncbi:peptidoglycan D,D-transpeptidase FtsI family protein [Paenibacillus rigui]|uniref:peptidoglycan D,D-transpeptidase FtsI family protein n=1 Tax=Paenibacillus rigui TaxID=554312 RepID=UPI001FE58CDB|nr:penicillin-binding protein 2 [Paenibacillus rigui]